MDERKQLMHALKDRALIARTNLYSIAAEAKVSGTVITRWVKHVRGEKGFVPSLATIGKLERALDRLEANSKPR